MKDQFEVNRFLVMQFDRELDSLVQVSNAMNLENCRMWLAHNREAEPDCEFSLVAVLDE